MKFGKRNGKGYEKEQGKLYGREYGEESGKVHGKDNGIRKKHRVRENE